MMNPLNSLLKKESFDGGMTERYLQTIAGTFIDIKIQQGERQAMAYLNRALSYIRDHYDFKPEDERFQRKISEFLFNIADSLQQKTQNAQAFLAISTQIMGKFNSDQ